MRHDRPAELVVGSVQLGLPYGAANRAGLPSREAALRLVRRAANSGIRNFDTARAYGESEERLGEALAGDRAVRTITKLSPLSGLSPDAARADVIAAVDASIAQSLAALRRDRLDCLLLHRAAHMTAHGGAIWERLIEYLEDGALLSLGVSVQSPAEAIEALVQADVRHLQLPFNLLDWRWREAGVIERLRARPDVTVHARSVFLQGVLAANDASVWPRVAGADPRRLIAWIDDTVRDHGRESAADLCLAFVRGQAWIDGVVVGMEAEDQLEANLRFFARPPLSAPDCMAIAANAPRVPEALLDPSCWPARP